MISLDSAYRRDIATARSPLAFALKTFWKQDRPWADIEAAPTRGQTFVYANHGNWKVDCPTIGCGGSLLASRVDPRFVCIECMTGPVEEVWPDEWERIAALLDVRPLSENRHWTPAETVDDLEHETAAFLSLRFMAGV